jgi:hypothetical protein
VTGGVDALSLAATGVDSAAGLGLGGLLLGLGCAFLGAALVLETTRRRA